MKALSRNFPVEDMEVLPWVNFLETMNAFINGLFLEKIKALPMNFLVDINTLLNVIFLEEMKKIQIRRDTGPFKGFFSRRYKGISKESSKCLLLKEIEVLPSVVFVEKANSFPKLLFRKDKGYSKGLF